MTLSNETVSTNPKDFVQDGPKPKDPGETGGLPIQQPRPKVGDRLQFAGRMWVIRKITKKDLLLRPWHG